MQVELSVCDLIYFKQILLKSNRVKRRVEKKLLQKFENCLLEKNILSSRLPLNKNEVRKLVFYCEHDSMTEKYRKLEEFYGKK